MPSFVSNTLAAINWSTPSWDMFIVLFFIVVSLIYGMSLGRDRILVILVSIYMALAVVKYAPIVTSFDAAVNINNGFAFRISVFLGLFILLFFFLSQSALMRSFGGAFEQGKWWQVMLFSVLHVGLLVSVTLSFLPVNLIAVLNPVTREAFVSDIARAIWVILPIAAMAFVSNGKGKS